MRALFNNIRFYILLISTLLLGGIILYSVTSFNSTTLQLIRINQLTSFASLIYLYLALLPSPLFAVFPHFPLRDKITKARRALGVSAFFFGLIHALIAFFGQLQGFEGLSFLTSRYLIALFLGFLALQILAILALTSFDKMIAKMTFPKWKRLHRLIYVAGILILIHTFMLGTHYADLSETIPQFTFILFSTLLLLEAIKIDGIVRKKYSVQFPLGVTSGFTLGIIGILYFFSFLSQQGVSLGIHSQHIQIAKEAQQSTIKSSNPALTGDRSKRYTVGMRQENALSPNVPTALQFIIHDASNGLPTLLYSRVYEKLMHLIIVDESLTYFEHIHPEQNMNIFTITTTFPENGRYHLYTDFQPLGAIEQQMGFTLTVGEEGNKKPLTTEKYSDEVDGYIVALQKDEFRAKELSLGNKKIVFTIKDKNENPITSLKPYLASFGHLVMINTSTYDYLHVHPFSLIAPQKEATSGPTVEFLPLGLYGPIKPGIYRVFAQFNPDNKLITTDFTIRVQ